MERLFYAPTAGPTPPPRNMARAEGVWFESGDGTRLFGWFIPAATRPREAVRGESEHDDPASQPAPTILHVHGNAGNIDSHLWFTDYLPAAGFNLFIFDYRGYGQSEGAARSRGPLIADTHAALDAILKRTDVDPTRIGMYGQSLGGAIGLNVMAARSEIRAAVIESPFTSWHDMAACALGGAAPNFACRCAAGLLIPDSHRVDHAIARIDRPVLLLHGDADSIIPVEHSRQLKAAGGENVQLIELPGGDHNSLRDSHPQIESMVIEFFRKHLSATPETPTLDR